MSTKVKLWKVRKKARRVRKNAADRAKDVYEVAREVVKDAVDSGRESLKQPKRRKQIEETARDFAAVAAATLEEAAHRFQERQEAKHVGSNGKPRNSTKRRSATPASRKRKSASSKRGTSTRKRTTSRASAKK